MVIGSAVKTASIHEAVRLVAWLKGGHKLTRLSGPDDVPPLLPELHAQGGLLVLQIDPRDASSVALAEVVLFEPAARSLPILWLLPESWRVGKAALFDQPSHRVLSEGVSLFELGQMLGEMLGRTGSSAAPTSLRAADLVLDCGIRRLQRGRHSTPLTPMEFRLLRHFMANPAQVFSSQELLVSVWGYPLGEGNTDAVRLYVKRLRKKLERDPSRPQLLLTANGHGYYFSPSEPNPAKEPDTARPRRLGDAAPAWQRSAAAP